MFVVVFVVVIVVVAAGAALHIFKLLNSPFRFCLCTNQVLCTHHMREYTQLLAIFLLRFHDSIVHCATVAAHFNAADLYVN